MNLSQIKLDNKARRQDLIRPKSTIDNTYKSYADSEYEKKKTAERQSIINQLNRAYQ